MASGSSFSSLLFFGTTGTADNMELTKNSQQDLKSAIPTSLVPAQHNHHLVAPKKQSNQPGPSHPNADFVVVVSPTTLLDANRYVCEVCYKGFPRKQNLTLHRRAHNLPFTLKTRTPKDTVPKKVYLCPEPTCVHHNSSHGLGDFGGLKKHYLRKHCTQKKYKCDTCSKAYTVETDLRAHSKICGRKKYICHCGCRFSRSYNFTVHQENCDAGEHVGAAKDPQTLNMGDSSVKSTRNNNRRTLIGPQISSIQNQYNSYPSTAPDQFQLCQFGADHSSLMTDPSMGLNLSEIPPAFFHPSSTHQNQHEFRENFDIGFYADLLMDKIPLHNVNLEDMSLMGDAGNTYETGEGSNSFSDGGFMLDPSSSLNLTPAIHNTSRNGMLNPVSGSNDGGSYELGGYYGYGDGSRHFDYGGGKEVFNFETSAATAGAAAPSEQYLNQHGFWF